MKKSTMIYTPNRGIPIGEATISGNGIPALIVKKSKSAETDEIPLDDLIKQMVQKTDSIDAGTYNQTVCKKT